MIINRKMEFVCPYCRASFIDLDEVCSKRINKNKTGVTRILCHCKKYFYLTYDMKGNFVAYKGEKK